MFPSSAEIIHSSCSCLHDIFSNPNSFHPSIHHFLFLFSSPPVPLVAPLRGSRPFTGEGTNKSHLPRLTGFFVRCNGKCMQVFVVKPRLFNICLLHCSCFLLHPCRHRLWKMLLSFHPCWNVHKALWKKNAVAEVLLFYIAVVITRSQMEKEEFSSRGLAVLLDIENRLFFFPL